VLAIHSFLEAAGTDLLQLRPLRPRPDLLAHIKHYEHSDGKVHVSYECYLLALFLLANDLIAFEAALIELLNHSN
jgi:hypothetical protein